MQIRIRRVHRGNITIPSYIVDHFIKENETLVAVYKDKTMTLTPDILTKDVVSEGPKNHVILGEPVNGYRYSLYYYKWQPDED